MTLNMSMRDELNAMLFIDKIHSYYNTISISVSIEKIIYVDALTVCYLLEINARFEKISTVRLANIYQ